MQLTVRHALHTLNVAGLLIGLLLLPGCGFHLRSAIALPEPLQQTVARGVAPYSELGLVLSRAWSQSGGSLSFGTKPADGAQLLIKQQAFARRTLAVDSAGRPTEYELNYTLGFALQDAQGEGLIEPQTISLFREYRFDPANVLAKSDEEARIRKEMIRTAAQQMLRRINIQFNNRPSTTPTDAEPTMIPEHETAR